MRITLIPNYMNLQAYKNNLRKKILDNDLSNFDKGLDQNGKIIADYPVVERVGSTNIIDAKGDIDRLHEIKQQLEKEQPFTRFQIKYIPQRTNIYCELCKELGVVPRLYDE
ncbi:hypothetical protein [Candidatus Uabimicrobium sp. HlEnr_7]|uniref:hypothetical protein n=1 Tax=Candidatus Uabimicrobium helgolandensis TaxID=3095367 RepID=UPI003558A6C6